MLLQNVVIVLTLFMYLRFIMISFVRASIICTSRQNQKKPYAYNGQVDITFYFILLLLSICLKKYYYLENIKNMSKLQTSGSRTSCTREHVNENKQTNNKLQKCKNISNNDSFLY